MNTQAEKIADSLGALAADLAQSIAWEQVEYDAGIQRENEFILIRLYPRTNRGASVLIGRDGKMVWFLAGILKLRADHMARDVGVFLPQKLKVEIVPPEN